VSRSVEEVALSAEDTELLSAEAIAQFRTLADALLSIARGTRPDIVFAVHKMTRRTRTPRMCDFKMGKCIPRYLNEASDYRLNVVWTIEGSAVQLEVFTDADWASESEDRKLVNAVLTFMNGMIISLDEQEPLVALSTIEIEFVSAARGVQEAMGCDHIVKELERPIQMHIKLKMDNQAAIKSIMNEAGTSD
jgi:hypothetical protein